MEFIITIRDDRFEKHYLLNETVKAVKNDKTGKTCLAQFQPTQDNPIIKGFSKCYFDSIAWKELSKEKAKTAKS